jgi:hypothetical protein
LRWSYASGERPTDRLLDLLLELLHVADDGSGFVLCLICGEILVEAKPVEVLPFDHLMKLAALARMRRHGAPAT